MSRKLLMGKKSGMTQFFDENGKVVPCTVITFDKNVVVQVKTKETDGYAAVQVGYDLVEANDPRRLEARTKKPQRGHFKKAGVAPLKKLKEFRVEETSGYEVGQELDVTMFENIKFVDVTGMSKGKGFQGVMKLHNYAGGPASHGSAFHRARGSQGMRTTPGRCFPGAKRPGLMGNRKVTTQNVKIMKIDQENNLIVVVGSIPGPIDGRVCIAPAIKKKHK